MPETTLLYASGQIGFPILSVLIFTPLLAAGVAFGLKDLKLVRQFSIGITLFELLLSFLLIANFDTTSGGMQFVERRGWISGINAHYTMGIDGISILFIPLTILLTSAVILAAWTRIRYLERFHFACLLALLGITLGIFCALDLILFFVFWELSLIPTYFLIRLWGIGPERRHAAVKYTITMLAGSAVLLLGFIYVAQHHAQITGIWSFDYLDLIGTPLSLRVQAMAFILLFVGFAVKAPLFPFHTWLPTVLMEGQPGVSALLIGVKLGAYGILRFAMPLAPAGAQNYAWFIAVLGAIGVLYGALIALHQSNLRRMLAYSSISHVGLVMIGLAAMSLQGVQGAIYQLLNFTVLSGGLFLLTGFLQHRLGSTDLIHLGGIARVMPRLTTAFFLLGLGSIGMPGTNGFVAEQLVLFGALRAHAGLSLAPILSMILGAAYFLRIFQQAFYGPLSREELRSVVDLRPREMIVAGGLGCLVLLGGLFPNGVLELTEPTTNAWVARIKLCVQNASVAANIEGNKPST